MDDFSDEEFDGLNDVTLQELENNAIQLTQAQRKFDDSQPAQGTQVETYDDLEFEDDDLDDTEVTNQLLPPAARPLPDKTIPQHQTHLARRPSLQTPQRWNHPPAPVNQPAISARPRYPAPVPSFVPPVASQRFKPPVGAPHRPQLSQYARPPPPSTRYNPPQSQTTAPVGPAGSVVAALQQQLKALQADLNAARGEVTIIRSNSAKAQQDHAAEIARLKKQNAEQAAKQESAVEAAITKERQATTELQFLQRDLKDAASRPRRKDAAPQAPAPGTTTPRKTTKTWGMADGFDDMDIAPSPTKTRGKTRDSGAVAVPLSERTPTKGKRKRPTVDSPVMALEVHAGDVPMADDATVTAALPVQQFASGISVLPFEFLQVILDHGSLHGEPPTFDILSRYAFPSDPATSFSAFIFRELPLMGNPSNPVQLLVDFARLVIRMWAQCLDETYLRPVWDLTSLLSFTLQLQTMSVAPLVIDDLVPVAVNSIYMVAEARFKRNDTDGSTESAAEALEQDVDSTYILSLLYASAAACATVVQDTENGSQTRQAEIWQLITVDMVLALLTSKQRLADVVGMLDMLCTSVLPNSIGPIVPGKPPEFIARILIDRVSMNLVELPRAAVTGSEKHAVRFAVLRTLMNFARSPFGARQIASHVSVIPRLVTTLGELVDGLYDLSDPVIDGKGGGSCSWRKDGTVDATPGDPRDKADDWDDGRSGSSLLISQIVLLLHTLATDPNTANVANILSKLSVSHGGSQRYMLSLSRLNFSEEDLVYEAGIDADTVDRAHELLEIGVTPDEGDSVAESFGV